MEGEGQLQIRIKHNDLFSLESSIVSAKTLLCAKERRVGIF